MVDQFNVPLQIEPLVHYAVVMFDVNLAQKLVAVSAITLTSSKWSKVSWSFFFRSTDILHTFLHLVLRTCDLEFVDSASFSFQLLPRFWPSRLLPSRPEPFVSRSTSLLFTAKSSWKSWDIMIEMEMDMKINSFIPKMAGVLCGYTHILKKKKTGSKQFHK